MLSLKLLTHFILNLINLPHITESRDVHASSIKTMCRQMHKFSCGHKQMVRVRCVNRADVGTAQHIIPRPAATGSCDSVLPEGRRTETCDACLGKLAEQIQSPGGDRDGVSMSPSGRGGGQFGSHVASWVEEQSREHPPRIGRDRAPEIVQLEGTVRQEPRAPRAHPMESPEVINIESRHDRRMRGALPVGGEPYNHDRGRSDGVHAFVPAPNRQTRDRQGSASATPVGTPINSPTRPRAARIASLLRTTSRHRERPDDYRSSQQGEVLSSRRAQESTNFSTFRNPRAAPMPPVAVSGPPVTRAALPRAATAVDEQPRQPMQSHDGGGSNRQPTQPVSGRSMDGGNNKQPSTPAESSPIRGVRRDARSGELKLGRRYYSYPKKETSAADKSADKDGFFARLLPRRRNSTSGMPSRPPTATRRPAAERRPSTSASLRESLRRVGSSIQSSSPFRWRRPGAEDESFACVTARKQTRAGLQAHGERGLRS